MNKEENKILPQLRFPEFINDKEWKIEPFNDVYSFKITNSFSRDKLNYEKGTVKNIHYGDIHTKFSTHFDILKEDVPFINPETSIDRIDADNYCKEGDLVIADASEDIEDIGKSIEIINLNKEKLLAGLHTFLARPIYSKITIGFGGHLFKSNGIVAQIKKEAQGAKVLGVSKGRLSNLNVYFPVNPKEQQKIANCLSSLDDVINEETEKLDLLQDHKKGLLQQLFPQQEESQPKYRFPEFVDDGVWEEKRLGEIAVITIGEFVIKSKQNPNSPYPVYNGGKSYTGFYDKYNNEANKIVVSARGANAGFVNIVKRKYWAGNSCYSVALTDDDFNLIFLYNYVKRFQNRFTDNQQAANIPSVSKGDVSQFIIMHPINIKEQQKIANCLSSVDELIGSQQQKIENLKAHKKGLLQKLFPKVNVI